jgi:uncharacterized membrane protein YeaQ/YmgE (transglycosylase-associated protein family)
MYFLWFIIVGCAVGWQTGNRLKGNGFGPLMDLIMGVSGALAGGLLMRSAGLTTHWSVIATTLTAMIGAAVLTLLVGLVNGRRLYARQL